MRSIVAENVNHALMDGIMWLKTSGVKSDSRNGPVLRAPGPVCTTYLRPQERVLFHPRRDANPVFHLMESLWMLAGRKNVEFLLPFNSGFDKYAEPDGAMWGAYGHRWREHFGMDQLMEIVMELSRDPNSRQAVLAMWDPRSDLNNPTKKDRPCNTHIYFEIFNGVLNMTVCCRSNDVIWGAYGANAVHMSIMHEWMANALSVPMGVYRQISNNFHIYTDLPLAQNLMASPPFEQDYYAEGRVKVVPLLRAGEYLSDFLLDCKRLTEIPYRGPLPVNEFSTFFMREVAGPLRDAYLERKATGSFVPVKTGVPSCDWVVAYTEWCERRA